MRSVRSPLYPLLAACIALAGCDGLLVDPAESGRLPLAVVLVADAASAGPAEAFDAADAIQLRLRQGERTVLERTESFSSGGTDVSIPLSVESDFDGANLTIEVMLVADGAPLFSGAGSITPVAGRTTSAEVTLSPIIADIQISPAEVTFDAIGATAQFTGTALFATGDDIPGVPIVFSALSDDVVQVSADGAAVALAEGTAQVQARSGTVTSAVTVTVDQVVTAIDFGNAPTDIPLGSASTFRVTLRDRNGYEIRNRTVQWSSSDPRILQIDADGVATPLAPGTVTITATVDGVSNTFTVRVVAIPIIPTGLTASASGVTVSLNWQDASNDETSFEVWRRTGAGSAQPFAVVATLPANTTSFTEQTAVDQQFEYVVRACSNGACSGNSAPAVVVTVPMTPVNVSADFDFDGNFILVWQDASSFEQSYVIERTLDPPNPFVQIDQLPANSTIWVFPVFSNDYFATYRVVACNTAGCSAPSGGFSPSDIGGSSEGLPMQSTRPQRRSDGTMPR